MEEEPDLPEEQMIPYENDDDPENFIPPKSGFPKLPEGYEELLNEHSIFKKYNLARGRKHKGWAWTRTNDQGDSYEGRMKKEKMNGLGRILKPNGEYKHGRFKAGELVEGIHIVSKEKFNLGKFQGGKLIEES